MSSYSGNANPPDRAKAVAAVVVIHVALAAVIVTGLNVDKVRYAVEQLKTFNISEVPPPPNPPPRPAAPEPHHTPKPAAAPASKAQASPVVAPEPKIPEPSPVAAARVAGTGGAANSGAANAGSGSGAGGSGTGTGGGGRLFALHAGAAGQQHPEFRISRTRGDGDTKRPRGSDNPRSA